MERYWLLPYEYILEAVQHTNKLRFKELHENEVPIAMIACQQAEFNRDRKKKKKPYELDDFYCFKMADERDTVDARYGSAANELIKMQLFPAWALFIYRELMQNASRSKPPEVLCYYNDEAIILAPARVSDICKGMLIATEKASFRVMEFKVVSTSKDVTDDTIRIRLPEIKGKTAAIENCCMDVLS